MDFSPAAGWVGTAASAALFVSYLRTGRRDWLLAAIALVVLLVSVSLGRTVQIEVLGLRVIIGGGP